TAHKENLEELIVHRTAELHEKAQKLEKYSFFVAHELKKPLDRMVNEMCERLKALKAQSAAGEIARWVAESAKDVTVMIERMLKWARVADRDAKRLVPNDCAPVFATATAKLKDTIAATGARVSRGRLPTVMAGQGELKDWPELVLLFENLIGNALKYR